MKQHMDEYADQTVENGTLKMISYFGQTGQLNTIGKHLKSIKHFYIHKK